MDKFEIIELLDILSIRPRAFNYIEEPLADWLVEHGYFNDKEYILTDNGINLLVDLKKSA